VVAALDRTSGTGPYARLWTAGSSKAGSIRRLNGIVTAMVSPGVHSRLIVT
jgi:hypothetical protein